MRAHPVKIQRLTELGRAEHIQLKEDSFSWSEPEKQPHRITRHHFRLHSPLHGYSIELALLEDHYLRVHSRSAKGTQRKYQLDLRHASPRPVRIRHIAWLWLIAGVVQAAAALGALSVIWEIGLNRSSAVVSAVTFVGAALAACMFLRRTTETLEFRSEHGMATLVAVTGGLGSGHRGKSFFIELIKSIHAARAECTQSRQQQLAGEMREHHRLRELGVLSQREYEQSKARILAEHAI